MASRAGQRGAWTSLLYSLAIISEHGSGKDKPTGTNVGRKGQEGMVVHQGGMPSGGTRPEGSIGKARSRGTGGNPGIPGNEGTIGGVPGKGPRAGTLGTNGSGEMPGRPGEGKHLKRGCQE